MKKILILFFALFFSIQNLKAQSDNVENDITDTQLAIIDKLDKLARGGDRDGKTLNYWNYLRDIPNNQALFEFTYLGEENGGVYENDYRFRIDMSKVDFVKMGKSNGGDDGIGFFAKNEQALQRYAKNHDWTVGDVKYREDSWEDSVMLFMPHDEELLELFKQYVELTKADRKLHPEKYGTLPDPDYNNNANYEKQLTAEEKAQGEAGIAIAEGIGAIMGNFMEFSGSASFTNPITYDSSNYDYEPTKAYELNEARLILVYGEKNWTFNLSPGYSWMSLPSYRKFNVAGEQVEYTDFGSVQFFAPSAGISYKFMSKESREDYERNFEFPLTISFTPLLAGKSDTLKINNEIFDTPFEDYFSGFSYYISTSIGANLYFGKGIGMGLSVGATYVSVKATEDEVTQTINNKQEKFTITMDDLSPIIPRVELKLIFRL